MTLDRSGVSALGRSMVPKRNFGEKRTACLTPILAGQGGARARGAGDELLAVRKEGRGKTGFGVGVSM